MESYLRNRAQRVVLDGGLNVSSIEATACGVPQGSTLGPIFFSILIFHLPAVLTFSHVHVYADDIELHRSMKPDSIEENIRDIQYDIDMILNYSDDHGLRLNPNKTLARQP
ncbi:hypothetical protein JTB14_033802 [Gonioctena quinquepunctata]|nr:hypothetical protein JTB14_033802 [Gonioctena quinquepunctata]